MEIDRELPQHMRGNDLPLWICGVPAASCTDIPCCRQTAETGQEICISRRVFLFIFAAWPGGIGD